MPANSAADRSPTTPAGQPAITIAPEVLGETHATLIETQRAALRLTKEHTELELHARKAKAEADTKKAELDKLKAEAEMDYIRSNPRKWVERQGGGPAGSPLPPDATAIFGPLGSGSPLPALPSETPVVRMAYTEGGVPVAVIALESNVYRVTEGQRVGPYTVKAIGPDYVDLLRDGKLRRIAFGMSARALAATADRDLPTGTSTAPGGPRPPTPANPATPPPDSTSPALRMP